MKTAIVALLLGGCAVYTGTDDPVPDAAAPVDTPTESPLAGSWSVRSECASQVPCEEWSTIERAVILVQDEIAWVKWSEYLAPGPAFSQSGSTDGRCIRVMDDGHGGYTICLDASDTRLMTGSATFSSGAVRTLEMRRL